MRVDALNADAGVGVDFVGTADVQHAAAETSGIESIVRNRRDGILKAAPCVCVRRQGAPGRGGPGVATGVK
jgi:hypothetical protein